MGPTDHGGGVGAAAGAGAGACPKADTAINAAVMGIKTHFKRVYNLRPPEVLDYKADRALSSKTNGSSVKRPIDYFDPANPNVSFGRTYAPGHHIDTQVDNPTKKDRSTE